MDFQYLKNIVSGVDRNAILDELMMTYGKEVWNYAFFLTNSRELAEDIAQDVFVKVYRSLDEFRGEASMKTWLLTITRHMALDYLRSAWMRRVRLFPLFRPAAAHPSAESEWFVSREQQRLWEHVLRLPRKLRETLLLHVHHRLTLKEIAAMLDISEGTVKSRLHRARAAVSRGMREDVPEESEGFR